MQSQREIDAAAPSHGIKEEFRGRAVVNATNQSETCQNESEMSQTLISQKMSQTGGAEAASDAAH